MNLTKQFLYEYISKHRFGVLATVTENGFPESAYMGIAVTKDLKLIFDTVSDSRKYKNLTKNPNIAFVIGWENEQTLQYEGIAKIPDYEELKLLLPVYFEVFPDGKFRQENWKNLTYFCVEPRWIRFFDFNKSSGQISEMMF